MTTEKYCEFTGDKDTPWDGIPNRVCRYAGFRWCTKYREQLGCSEDGWRTCCESCEHPFQNKKTRRNNGSI